MYAKGQFGSKSLFNRPIDDKMNALKLGGVVKYI